MPHRTLPRGKRDRGYGIRSQEMLDRGVGNINKQPHCHLQNPGHRAELKHDPKSFSKGLLALTHLLRVQHQRWGALNPTHRHSAVQHSPGASLGEPVSITGEASILWICCYSTRHAGATPPPTLQS